MKKLLLICFVLAVGAVGRVSAQCATCTPVSCSAIKPTGGLCNFLPDDTAGMPYDEVISFYMPKQLTDPATLAQCSGCNYVELRHIRIAGITGLPTGMSASPNHSNGYYDVQNNDSIGCVRFCGTPVAPGVYYIVVNLIADVTAHGTPIGDVDANNQAQTYRDTIEIFPGTSECPQSFSLGSGPCQLKACDSVNVNLNATLTNPDCPTLISYAWDLGNGTNSAIKTPGVVNYLTPDTFELSLTTTFYSYRITEITVELTGGYTGDIEELTGLSNPDPYVTIPAIGYSSRGTGSDQDSKTISGLQLVIPGNACASPLSITAWDEDTGPPVGSPDDNCGTHVIVPSTPNQVSNTTSNSKLWVTFDTVAVSSLTEKVNVIVFPHPPLPEIVASLDSICNGDSTIITLLEPVFGFAYNWYLNDTTELQSTDSFLVAKLRGQYKLKITNTVTGCSEWSAPIAIAVGQPAPASENIVFNGTQAFVTPFPSSGFAVDWYYNGNLVVGQNGKFLPYLGDGLYSAEVYNISFPFCRTAAGPDSIVKTVGIEDLTDNSVYDINVFPNPNNGKFRVTFTSAETQDIRMVISSMIGQTVVDRKINSFNGQFNEEMDLNDLGKGVYVVTIETANGKHNSRVVVQ